MIIEHRVRPGCRDEVRVVWEKWLRPAIEANSGHEEYFYLFDNDDADVIRAFQQYVDTAAAIAFLSTPAYEAYVAEVQHLLIGPPRVVRTDIVWAKPR